MRRFLVLSSAALMVLFASRSASALTLTTNFCPGDATCPSNITEASLTFTDVANADPNDYNLVLKIVGGSGDPTYIDMVSFTINTAENEYSADGYTTVTLTSAPAAGATWVTYFSNVNNSPTACTSSDGSSKEVCSNGSDPGAIVNGTNTWNFYINLGDNVAPLAAGTSVNLRAVFTNADGKNGGILSPGGGTLQGGAGGENGSGGGPAVPEPASLVLLGSGLAFAAARFRKRQQ